MDNSRELQQLRNITYVWMTLVQASIELESMKAENKVRESADLAPAYGEKQFMDLIEKHGVNHNSVLTAFFNGL